MYGVTRDNYVGRIEKKSNIKIQRGYEDDVAGRLWNKGESVEIEETFLDVPQIENKSIFNGIEFRILCGSKNSLEFNEKMFTI